MPTAASSLWSDLSWSDWLNIVGVGLVLVGVVGEVIPSIVYFIKHRRNPYSAYSPNDPRSMMPLELFSKRHKWETNKEKRDRRKELSESIFGALLVIGLMCELIALLPSIKEVLQLKTHLAELQLKLKDSHITLEQEKKFMDLMVFVPKQKIKIWVGRGGSSTFSEELKKMLKDAGFDCGIYLKEDYISKGVIVSEKEKRDENYDVYLIKNDTRFQFSTNGTTVPIDGSLELVSPIGNRFPYVPTNKITDTAIVNSIAYGLTNIGLTSQWLWYDETNLLNQGEAALLIMPKHF